MVRRSAQRRTFLRSTAAAVLIAAPLLAGAPTSYGAVTSLASPSTEAHPTVRTGLVGGPGVMEVGAKPPGGGMPHALKARDVAHKAAKSPSIRSVSPNMGPASGGTRVTITGANLSRASSVTFGGTAAKIVRSTATTVTVIAPEKAAGTYSVTVRSPGGSATRARAFSFEAVKAPSISRMRPHAGPVSGGTRVTFKGANLSRVSSVTFGGTAAKIVRSTATSLAVAAPAMPAGSYSVVVTTAEGTVDGPGGFTYLAEPTMTAVSPSSGSVLGGQRVTITGTNMSFGASVAFGETSATVVDFSYTTVTVVTPAMPAGSYDISLTTPGGTTTGVKAFTFLALPTITGLSPMSGPLSGGDRVTITGANLEGVSSVTIGGVAATIVEGTESSVTVVTPAMPAGAHEVSVTTDAGTATASRPFTYVAAPTIAEVSPTLISVSGGGRVTISGANLSGVSAVTVGGTAATIVESTESRITADVPAMPPGSYDLVVVTPGGIATLPDALTSKASPRLTEISPSFGATSGGERVVITGENLSWVTSVTFGGTVAAIVARSDSSITVFSPAMPAGTTGVAIMSPGQVIFTTTGFTYVAAPRIGAVSPASGSTAGGDRVTITGTDLSMASSVTFGGIPATIVDRTDVTVTAISPAVTAGTYDVAVVTPGGTALRYAAFTFIAPPPPSILGVSPSSGSTSGGQLVTIAGASLAGATSVKFGGVNATIVEGTDSSLTVITPAISAGTYAVSVSTPGGTTSRPAAFTFVSAPVATITGVSQDGAQMTVSWGIGQADRANPITGFTVTTTRFDGAATRSCQASSTARSCTLQRFDYANAVRVVTRFEDGSTTTSDVRYVA